MGIMNNWFALLLRASAVQLSITREIPLCIFTLPNDSTEGCEGFFIVSDEAGKVNFDISVVSNDWDGSGDVVMSKDGVAESSWDVSRPVEAPAGFLYKLCWSANSNGTVFYDAAKLPAGYDSQNSLDQKLAEMSKIEAHHRATMMYESTEHQKRLEHSEGTLRHILHMYLGQFVILIVLAIAQASALRGLFQSKVMI